MEDVPNTVLHELIHALHFRNEHARWAEGDYKRAIAGLRDLLATYQRSIKERGSALEFYDWYASTDIYEFLVGVVQVLAGEIANLPTLTAFVEQNNQEIKSHAFGIPTAKMTHTNRAPKKGPGPSGSSGPLFFIRTKTFFYFLKGAPGLFPF
jgi:hypothetical protein